MWQRVVAWEYLQQQREFGFVLEAGDTCLEGFVLCLDGGLYAYHNTCPHRAVTLNWNPHQFLDGEQHFIQCAMHGALFNPRDGLCVHGPCLHQRLQALPVRLDAGEVQVWYTGTAV